MCGCFVVALGAFFPRIALLLLWLFGDTISRAFDGEWLLPVLGWLILPYTTLVYVLLYWWLDGVTGFAWFFVVLAFFADVGSWTGAFRGRPASPQPVQ